MTNPIQNSYSIKLLQIGLLSLLLGRGWLLFKKPAPITSLIYHPRLEGFWSAITGLGVEEFLGSTALRATFVYCTKGIALFLLVAALVTVFYQKISERWNRNIAFSTVGILVFLSFCFYLSKQNQIVQFFEYASQMAMPLLFYFYYKNKEASETLFFWTKIAIALTFICHGLYALGVYPQPGHFIDMMIQGFGLQEDTAKSLLVMAGILDIIFAIGLFVPNKRVYRISLYYLLIWGLLTTFARLVSNVDFSLGWYSWNQWLPECLVRFPHFILPLFLVLFKPFQPKLAKNIKV